MRRAIFSGLALSSVLVIACSGADFSAAGGKAEKKSDEKSSGVPAPAVTDVPPADTASAAKPIDIAEADTAATGVTEDPAKKFRAETFAYGADTVSVLADYLFIYDNSCSFGTIRDKTRTGLISLASDKLFPAKSRLAFMTTLIGKTDDLSVIHASVSGYQGIDADPGFLRLISRKTFADFKAATTVPYAATIADEGCEDSWFKPEAKNAAGKSCIEAAFQNPFHCVGTEAGLHAFMQLHEKNKGQALFRAGAIANVIYISDTHDPGNATAAAQVLVDTRPTFEAMKAKAMGQSAIVGLKVHAIAPDAATCTGEQLHDKSYFKVTEASGGEKLDVCTTDDYTPVIKKIVDNGAKPPEPLFVVGRKVAKVLAVFVDDKATTDFVVDGERVRVNGLDPAAKVAVRVEFEYVE